MNIALISFTRQGAKTCKAIVDGLQEKQHKCKAFTKASFAEEAGLASLDMDLEDWTRAAFEQQKALIFVGACGIAVRAIAPYVNSKTTDPAVVVVDEKGQYVISLLSGHLGGANELTLEVADLLGAQPVITTATDIQGLFAVDEWAKGQHLFIEDMTIAKEISAALLAGQEIGVVSDYPIEGNVTKQLAFLPQAPLGIQISIYESQEKRPFQKTLRLIPKTLTLGIGCRKGTDAEAIKALLEKTLAENNLSPNGIKEICSIDLKKDEEGIHKLADMLKVPFRVFTPEELKAAPGEFTPSDFVRETTGVDNVCERAAVLGSGGQLMIKKQALNGVTLAIAIKEETYRWT